MVLLCITLLIALASVSLSLMALRAVARDTYALIAQGTARARSRNVLTKRLAFAALWLLIFTLAFL